MQILFFTFINLIYSVKFDHAQTNSWLSAIFIGAFAGEFGPTMVWCPFAVASVHFWFGLSRCSLHPLSLITFFYTRLPPHCHFP